VNRSRGPLAHLEDALRELDEAGLRRSPAAPGAAFAFSSNDYLGLAGRFAPGTSATGAGASRLLAGEHDAHRRLEEAFASWLGLDAALAFTSGYAANVGAVSAIVRPGDLVVSDALNHASLIDGARLSRGRIEVAAHNDAAAVERLLRERREERAWVLVESYYSMDADGPDLAELRAVCDRWGAGLLVDEAHALGVLGPEGRGRCAEAGVRPDVLVGTLGKSFGSQGAIVAGPAVVRAWLWNAARSFVFSTGLAPVAADAARLALEHLRANPQLPERVLDLAARLRGDLARRAPRLKVLGTGHVVPVVAGSAADACRLSALLAERGIAIPPVRPPTVPPGTARLRVTVSARQSESDLDELVAAFAWAAERLT
jgi:8-amino-7-oxononanoate synthase